MPRGRPATGREEYMRIKLHKDTHRLWSERKQVLQLKSDNELALHLLNLPSVSVSPGAVRDRSPEHETIPITQSTELLRDQNMLEAREDGQSTESLYEARQDLSFVCGNFSAGNGEEEATTSDLARHLHTKKVY